MNNNNFRQQDNNQPQVSNGTQQSNGYQPLSFNQTSNSQFQGNAQIPQNNEPIFNAPVTPKKESNKIIERIKTGAIFAAVCLIIGTIHLGINGSQNQTTVDSSAEAKSALSSHQSAVLSEGAVLLNSDSDAEYINGDLTIEHNYEEDKSKVWIWDYAAEDGDRVQVFVDGVALGDDFTIYHTPKEITVPSVSEVKLVGTHDGGGGITYAIRYELNGICYFNGMDLNGDNTYTLQRSSSSDNIIEEQAQ